MTLLRKLGKGLMYGFASKQFLREFDIDKEIKKGVEFVNNGNFGAALQSFQSALSMNKSNDKVKYYLGLIHQYSFNNNNESLRYYNRIINSPNSSSSYKALAYKQIAIMYAANEDFKTSDKFFKLSFSENDRDADTYYYYGLLLHLANDKDSAKPFYKRAIELNPTYAADVALESVRIEAFKLARNLNKLFI